MRGFPALVLQFLDLFILLPAMVPNGTTKLSLGLGNTVPQAPYLVIRQVFQVKPDKLFAGQSQVTSISNFLTVALFKTLYLRIGVRR